jgi:hypothetical protein
MTKIIIDPELSKQLRALTEAMELCDPSGQVVGKFIPAEGETKWEPLSPVASDEELDRRARSGEKRYSTAEVLAHLENL